MRAFLLLFVVLFSGMIMSAPSAFAADPTVDPSQCEPRQTNCRCLLGEDTVRGNRFSALDSTYTNDSCRDYCEIQVERQTEREDTVPTTFSESCEVAGELAIVSSGSLSSAISEQANASACVSGTQTCLCQPHTSQYDSPSYTGTSPTESSGACLSYCEYLLNTPGEQSNLASQGLEPPNAYQYQCAVSDGSGGQILTVISRGELFNESILGSDGVPGGGGIPETDSSLLSQGAIIPSLSIAIPGLTEEDLRKAVESSGGKTQVNFIGVYIVALYNVLIALASFLSVVIIVVAGFIWLSSGGSVSAIGKSKNMIKNAIVGLVLLFSAFTIGNLIDGRLTSFEGLTLSTVDSVEVFPDGEHWPVTPRGDIPDNFSQITTSSNITVVTGNNYIISEAMPSLQKALREFNSATDLTARLTGGSRTPRRQLELLYDNCLKNPGGQCSPITCNPASRSNLIKRSGNGWILQGSLTGETNRDTILRELERVSDPSACPHSSGVAIDIWCSRNKGSDFKYEPYCQTELTKALTQNGFCRLSFEPWHFEYDEYKVSRSSCTTNATASYSRKVNGTITTINPTFDCDQWSYKDNECVKESN